MSLLILVLSLGFAIPAAGAENGTLYVDDDGICDGNTPCYTVIQDAIDAANSGDTVFVFAGTYQEDLLFDNSLNLMAEDLDTTIIIPNETEYPIDVTAEDVIVTMQEAGTTAASSFLMMSSVSANRYVDDDGLCGSNTPCHTAIQDAVNAASSGEVIYIYSGTYYEHVTIGKSLTLQGEDRDTTIVDGSGTGNVVYITASNVTIEGLTIRNGDNGISVIPNYSVHHFTFRNAVVTANVTEGIEMGHSHAWGYHVLEDCVISNNGAWGVYAHQFYNSVIRNCDVFGNSSGLDPAWGLGTLVTGNRVYDNEGSGIWFDSMRNSVAENNLVWGNGSVGVGLGYVANYNIVRDNTICANGYGLHANYAPVRYNRAYHNDLEANTTQASELGYNYWDNGYPSGGNYWADYTGVDTDLDGIGDTPYIFSGAQDNYPLMVPKNFQPVLIDSITGPTQPVSINDQPVYVGATFAGAVFSDPQLVDSHIAVWDWGDETTSTGIVNEVNGTVSGIHSYTEAGIYEVQLKVTNSVCSSDVMAYQYIEIVENTPPEVAVDSAAVSFDEGETAINNGTVSDADGDTVTLSASVGDITNNGDGTWTWSFPTSDGPSESQSVTISADDGNDGTASAVFDLTVNNVVPAIEGVDLPVDPVNTNEQPVSGSVTFSDPGTADTHDVTWDWGDGKSDTQFGITSPATYDHIYDEPGVYAVTLTVTDDDGGVDSATFQYVVIYDPEGGFVTGGGWIDSPLGAYTPDSTLTGKATFGFVAKYQKGANVPTGNTEFQFKVADLNFKSTSYNWLVVAGKKAIYKGVGTINGVGEYKFMLSAIDGDLLGGDGIDMFRIKIWDAETGLVVYDNMLGADDTDDPVTEIQGGSIVIHKAK